MKFTVEDKSVEKFLDVAPKKTSIAVVRAVNRGTTAARTFAARTVSKDMGLAVGVVKKNIDMQKASSKTEARGILRASLRRIPLINFGARGPEPSRGRGRGVSYKIGGGRKRIKSGFITDVGSGHRGVFKRAGLDRLPIREKFGPSIGRVFDLHRAPISETGAAVAEKELDRLLNRILGL